MNRQIIDLNDHPHNLCPAGKLEWADGRLSVYSVKAGFVAVLGSGTCINETFQTKREAIEAAQSV